MKAVLSVVFFCVMTGCAFAQVGGGSQLGEFENVIVPPKEAKPFARPIKTLILATVDADVEGKKGVAVVGMDAKEARPLQALLEKKLGWSNTEAAAREINSAILEYFRNVLHRPLVLTETEIQQGDRLVIRYLEAGLDDGGVVVNGGRWTNRKKIADVYRQYGVKDGSPVDESKVTAATGWLNSMQFRGVQPVYEAGAREGTSRVRVDVKDRFPVKPLLSASNSGTESTGQFRFSAGLLVGDAPLPGLWMTGHQMSLQYTTNETWSMNAFAGSYSIPLRWSLPQTNPISLQFSGSLVQVVPEMEPGFEAYESTSNLYTLAAAVVMPWKSWQNKTLEVSPSTEFGFDWKSYNSDMEFGGSSVYNTSPQIFEFRLEQAVTVRDSYGATTLSLAGVYSPGGFNAKNSDATYQQVQPGTTANFWILQGGVERVQRLPWEMTLRLKLDYQYTTSNLLPSEEISFGGATVGRGYYLDQFQGDSGAIGSVELLGPSWKLASFGGSNFTFQMVGFFDWAYLYSEVPVAQYGSNQEALSAGVGPRFQWGDRMSAKLDIGWPLVYSGVDESNDWLVQRVQFSVTFAY